MNRHFDVFPDPLAARSEENGRYDEAAARTSVDGLGAQLRAE